MPRNRRDGHHGYKSDRDEPTGAKLIGPDSDGYHSEGMIPTAERMFKPRAEANRPSMSGMGEGKGCCG